MANSEHVEIVRQGAEAITEFRKENPNVKLDLNDLNLRGADLQMCDLSFADLSSADMSEAHLTGAALNGALLRQVNLDGADLTGADLSEAYLNPAYLRFANMSGANLTKANLGCADLTGADLRNATLISANLTDADLTEAILMDADLACANLSGANLMGANVSGAILFLTIFGSIELSQAIGLESVIHHGPSTIGVDTLFRSNGKIPEVFLRGCGVPEDFITYLPSLVANPFDFYSCFISYSHEDKQFARQLHDRLQGMGIRCWLDEKELNPGDDLYHGIDRGIRIWDKVLLCASKHSLKSWWVDNEITIALERERELSKSTKAKPLKIIPLNLDGYMFKDYWKSGHRAMLRKRVAADFRNWKTDADEFDRQFERVVKALKTDGGNLPEPKPKLPQGRSNRLRSKP
jgi:hypothetical protein